MFFLQLPKYQRAASHIPFHVQKYPLSTATGTPVTNQPNATPVMPDARTLQPAPGEAASSDPTNSLFDGKRMRKAVIRKTVDYNSAVVRYIEVGLQEVLGITKCQPKFKAKHLFTLIQAN